MPWDWARCVACSRRIKHEATDPSRAQQAPAPAWALALARLVAEEGPTSMAEVDALVARWRGSLARELADDTDYSEPDGATTEASTEE